MEFNDTLNTLFGSLEGLWEKIKQVSVKAGRATTRIMLQLYFVLRAESTPKQDKLLIIGALAYQLLPRDLISTKMLGLLGLTDNAATLLVAYNKMKRHITPSIDMQVDEVLDRWFGPQEAALVL